jgi:Na+-driven multidrug efflux pump
VLNAILDPIFIFGLFGFPAMGIAGAALATIISMAAGTALVAVVGQNWGAGRFDRVNRARFLMNRAAVVYGLVMFAVALPAAGALATIFSDNQQVIDYTRWYLSVVMLGTIGLNLYNWTSEQLNAAGRPRWVVIINVAGTVGLLTPLTVLGARLFGFRGMVVGLAIGQVVLGFLATRVGRKELAGDGPAPVQCAAG